MEIQIVKAGWLHRQSSVLKRWKRCWFVLNRAGELMYFDSEDSHAPEETLVIRAVCLGIRTGGQCDFSAPENRSKACLLQLQLRQDDLKLCAESPDDMRAWQIALEEARVVDQTGNVQFQQGLMYQSGAQQGVMYQSSAQPGVVLQPGAQVMYQQRLPGYSGTVITTPGQYVVHNAANGSHTVVMSNQPNQVVCMRDPYYRRGTMYPYAAGSMMWGPYMW